MKNYEIISYTQLPDEKHSGDIHMKNKINISLKKLNNLKKYNNIKVTKYLYKKNKENIVSKKEYFYTTEEFFNLPRKAGKTKESVRIVLDNNNNQNFNTIINKFKEKFSLLEEEFIADMNKRTRNGSTGEYEEIVKYIFKELEDKTLKIEKVGFSNNIDLIVKFNNRNYYIEIKSVLKKINIGKIWKKYYSNIKNIYYDFNLNKKFYEEFDKWYYLHVDNVLFKDMLNNYLNYIKTRNYNLYINEIEKYSNDFLLKRQYISTNFANYIKIFYPFIEENYKKIFKNYVNKNFGLENYYIFLFGRKEKTVYDIINGKEINKKLSFERDHKQYKELFTLKPIFYNFFN